METESEASVLEVEHQSKMTAILETAMRLFVTQGFDQTPTSQISKEAGVATGTLFHHFENKEELIHATYIYCNEKGMKTLSAMITHEGSVEHRFQEMWEQSIRYGYDHQMQVAYYFLYLDSIYVSPDILEERDSLQAIYMQIFEDGEREGIFKDVPLYLLRQVFHGIYRSFAESIFKERYLDERLVRDGFQIAWDALRK